MFRIRGFGRDKGFGCFIGIRAEDSRLLWCASFRFLFTGYFIEIILTVRVRGL